MLLRFSWTSLNYVNLFILKRRPWKPLTRELRTVRGRRKKYGAENYGKPQKWVIIERTIRFWLLTYDGVIGPSDSLRIRIYFYSNNIICNILLLILYNFNTLSLLVFTIYSYEKKLKPFSNNYDTILKPV